MDFVSVVAALTISTIITLLLFALNLIIRIFAGKSINQPEYPPVHSTILTFFLHSDDIYDHLTSIARISPTFRILAPGQREIFTVDPKNVEHILKTRFDSYSKGSYARDILEDLLGHGIFAVDGDKWRQQRKLASSEFSTRVLRDFSCLIFRRKAAELVGVVMKYALARETLDAQDLLMRYTLDSIFEVGFGMDLRSLEGSSNKGDEFTKAFDEANVAIGLRFFDPLWKLKKFLRIGSQAKLKKSISTVDNFVYDLIRAKRKQFEKQQDSSGGKEDILWRFLVEREKEPERMDDKYLRDIILSFMIAGKDTSAITLSWFLYMICKNPHVQEKIAREIRQVTRRSNDDDDDDDDGDVQDFVERITEEALDQMQYLHAALSETLRLYPPVPVDMRCADGDDILPEGYRVEKGDNVYYMAYAMGRMTSIWGEDAEVFRPERWLKHGIFQPESPFKFTSFHAGPRICLGKDFAYRQMKIVSMALLHFFRFKMADDRRKLTYRRMLTLHLDGGLHLHAMPRITAASI